MAGVGRQAAVLAIARLANYALMFVTPLFLVRLLSVEQFGEYREFMVYVSMLQWMAAFSVNDSLLYFVPLYSGSMWRIVRQTLLLSAGSSGAVLGVVLILDLATGGALVGHYLVPVVIYVLCIVNFDFWESLFVSMHRAGSMLAYSATRLTLRVLVVLGAAYFTRDVMTIIWSLIVLESLRVLVAAVVWRSIDRSKSEPAVPQAWRAQLAFCIPTGITAILIMLNRNMSNLVVAKVLGAVALAHYTVGTYVEPLGMLSNSISTVLLPEMVRRSTQSGNDSLALWRRGCVINCLILIPIVIVLARYAELIVTTLFGAAYLPSVLVMQIFLLFIVRNCFDMSPPLRALNKTRPMVVCNILALGVSAIALWVLLPIMGLAGAVTAFVLSSLVEPVYLSICVRRSYKVTLGKLLPWGSVGKVVLAGGCAALLLIPSFWTTTMGPAGVIVASLVFSAAFVAAVLLLRVPEAQLLFEKLTQRIARA